MKHNQESIDKALKAVQAPEFENPDHEGELKAKLDRAAGSLCSRRSKYRLAFPPDWQVAGLLGSAAVVVCLLTILLGPLFYSRSIWAKTLEAMKRVNTAIVTLQHLSDGAEGSTGNGERMAKLFFRTPDRFAGDSPQSKVWIDGSAICVYDIQANKVSKGRIDRTAVGSLTDLLTTGPVSYRFFAVDYDAERDLGLTDEEGKTYRIIELFDSEDPTEKQEFLLDPQTLLPVEAVTYRRNEVGEPWRRAEVMGFDFETSIDDDVFVPKYPATAEVVAELGFPALPENLVEEWEGTALAIARHDDKYVAVTSVWVGKRGWIGLKFRTNLEQATIIPTGYAEDEKNQQRWGVDRFTLNNYLWAGRMVGEDGTLYLASNGPKMTPETRGREFSLFYHPQTDSPEIPFPKSLTVRLLANVTNLKRGETLDHYFDWKETPEKYQLFELEFPAPPPSVDPPDDFNDWDLEWYRRTGVEEAALRDWSMRNRNAGRDQEIYETISAETDEVKLWLGVSWLILLQNLGKREEMLAFYDKYEPYAIEKWGDEADVRGNLALCREIVSRKANEH